ncbi:MAG: AmpG family muropeptide MFS transporter [Thermoanaerobaculaceae bacterium]|nr:AmpG family muropeptide MFS transporter [Thermoanaerobaculaceae bacterium]
MTSQSDKKKFPPPWVFSIYFAEGFPYSLVRQISTVFFKDLGASLEWVGFTSIFGLPYVFKFLWSPFIDNYGTKRKWLLLIQGVITLFILLISFLCLKSNPLAFVGVGFLFLSILSATNDIASDGYYLEALNREEQSKFVGFQSLSYRLALILGGGGILYLSSIIKFSGAFFVSSLIFGAVFIFHINFLPKVEEEKAKIGSIIRDISKTKVILFLAIFFLIALYFSNNKEVLINLPKYPIVPYSGLFIIALLALFPLIFPIVKAKLKERKNAYSESFIAYFDREKMSIFLIFLVLYRLGESLILNMLYPMLKTIGFERGDYGIIYGTFGVTSSILGGIAGGALISKFGLKKVAWYLVLAQNIPNLFYAFLSQIYEGDLVLTKTKFFITSAFVVIETFGAGLGTSFFMVLIMRSTLKEFKASNMATATGIMNIASSMVGLFSGALVNAVGFSTFFIITFILTIPSMVMIPFLPFLNEEKRLD